MTSYPIGVFWSAEDQTWVADVPDLGRVGEQSTGLNLSKSSPSPGLESMTNTLFVDGALPFCTAHGPTPHEAVAEVELAVEAWLEAAAQTGRDIPAPSPRAVRA